MPRSHLVEELEKSLGEGCCLALISAPVDYGEIKLPKSVRDEADMILTSLAIIEE